MAASVYAEDLTCSVCSSLFSDPVTLLCGHSFCRKCVADCPSTQCPLCRTSFLSSDEVKRLPTTHMLKSLAEKAKEAAHKTNQTQDRPEAQWLCPDHDEKLKLFCVTDQQLTCIICRDGQKHDGHKFKPIKEAAESLRKELENSIEKLFADIRAIESLANKQREEITKTKERSHQLMSQMHKLFEEMHQFLRKREDEIKNELKNQEEGAVEEMTQRLNSMETALTENRELEVNWRGALKTDESERFLKSWTEGKGMKTPEHLFRPRADDLPVINTSLFLGPYESHLQFFMWKEMLQVIQPRAEPLSLRSDNTYVSVSDDRRSLFCAPKKTQNQQSVFGQTSGGSGFATVPSFGNRAPTSTQNQQSVFGQTSGGSGFGTVPSFGNHAPTSTKNQQSVFGQTSGGSMFGKSSSFSKSSGLFGSTPSQGPVSSPFGPPALSPAGGFTFGQSTNTCTAVPGKTYNAFSTNEFTSGQCYWEIEVGRRDYWELGIKDYFLKYENQKYVTSGNTKLMFTDIPRKIGIYLDCSSKKLSFYDADKMTRVHTMSCSSMSVPVSAYFNIRCKEPDHNPLTVCWY